MKRTNRVYVDFSQLINAFHLSGPDKLCGVVIHDDCTALDDALLSWEHEAITQPDAFAWKRFRGVAVPLRDGRLVVAIGTGMGCTGTSIVVHETLLQLGTNIPILKVGTCVGTVNPVGTTFLPKYAIADEGVAQWDERLTSGWVPDLGVFQGKRLVFSGEPLRTNWRNHIASQWHLLQGEFDCNIEDQYRDQLSLQETDSGVVWSTDAFYPSWCLPDLWKMLSGGTGSALKPVVEADKSGIVVQAVTMKASNDDYIASWDMECSAAFSAGMATGVKVAAALVISWASQHWTAVPETGYEQRAAEHASKIKGACERFLIQSAVTFLATR
jgi:uridine phosphorylase